MKHALLISGLALATSAPANASWLSKITGVDIKVRSSGTTVKIDRPQPEAIPEAIQHFPNDVQNFLNPAGTLLAVAIRDARDSVRPNANRVPTHVKEVLSPYIPAEILGRARWKTESAKGFGLDSLVLRVADAADAITLDDTIVFKSDPNAATPDAYELWAHELLHVIQYQNMGVEGFANAYSVDWNGLENQARQGAAEIRRAIERGGSNFVVKSDTYSGFSQIGSAPLNNAQFQQAGMQMVPPQNCIQWQHAPYGANLRNICNVNLAINYVTKQNPYNGQYYNLPCSYGCYLPAGQMIGYNSPQAGPIVNINFNFVP